MFTVPVALSVMVFFALCCQCASTLAVIRRETNSWRWPVFTFVYMTVLAYIGALVVYQVGSCCEPLGLSRWDEPAGSLDGVAYGLANTGCAGCSSRAAAYVVRTDLAHLEKRKSRLRRQLQLFGEWPSQPARTRGRPLFSPASNSPCAWRPSHRS